MEFIDHQTFECVSQGVEIVDPSEPRLHISCGNSESSINDQSQDCKSQISEGQSANIRYALMRLAPGIACDKVRVEEPMVRKIIDMHIVHENENKKNVKNAPGSRRRFVMK